MGKRGNQGERDAGMMKAVYDWWDGIERDCNVDVMLEMKAHELRQRYVVRLVARAPRTDGTDREVFAATCLWPDAEEKSLSAMLFALTTSFDRLSQDYLLDAPGIATARHK